MARFNADTIDNYGGQGGAGSYFSLKDDGDIATVRFLYNDANDIEGYAVHEVTIDGKKKYVNCLREYDQPIDECPFCKARYKQIAKLFIPVYNEDAEKVQFWERGKKFFGDISGICERYKNSPVVAKLFEIERHGKKGDTSTTYQIFPLDEPADDTKLDDFEIPDVLGTMVLEKSADDMEFYVENEYFPPEGDEPVRRSSRREESTPRRSGRRTPSKSDTF